MDSWARAKKLDSLVSDLAEAYTLIRILLIQLPVPLRIPASPNDDPIVAVRALSRAWELADWEPVHDKDIADHVRSMITDWLTAYELAVAAAESGPALWRINGMEAAIGRLRDSAAWVATHLAG